MAHGVVTTGSASDPFPELLEKVTRLSETHLNPLLPLKAYAVALNSIPDKVTSPENTFYLADLVLRCNGCALQAVEAEGSDAWAVRDFFFVALSGVLPWLPTVTIPEAPFEEAEEEAEEDMAVLYEPPCDANDLDGLEAYLRGVGDNRSVDDGAAATASLPFELLTLTLNNWVCVEMCFRELPSGFAIQRCATLARRCSAQEEREASVLQSSNNALRSTAAFSDSDDSASDQSSTINGRDGVSSFFGGQQRERLFVAIQELNASAQQLVLCNCPEALGNARQVLRVVEERTVQLPTEDGKTSPLEMDATFLHALGLFAAGAADEYQDPEGTLTWHQEVKRALQNLPPRTETGSSFDEEAARRYRLESLITQSNERLVRFVSAARAQAAAARAAVETTATTTSRSKKPRNSQNPTKKRASTVGGGKPAKGAKRAKPAANESAEQEVLILQVPPVDSTLRTSIRHLGLASTIFPLWPLEEALQTLSSVHGVTGCVSPFVEYAGGDAAAHPARSLFVLGAIVCTESPLQWALEAATVAASPQEPRRSVWVPYPLIDADGEEAGADVPVLMPGEGISGNRLTQLMALAGRFRCDRGGGLSSYLQLGGVQDGAGRGTAKVGIAATEGRHTTATNKGPMGGAPRFLSTALGPSPPASSLDGAKKGMANAVKLLGARLNNLLKAEKVFESRWAATEKVKSALMCFYVPHELATVKVELIRKKRQREIREDRAARAIVAFFRWVAQQRSGQTGFRSWNDRRMAEDDAAAIVFQKYVRRWLARQERKRLEAKRAKYVANVTTAQSMYRRNKATRRVEAIRQDYYAAAEAKGAEDRRHFAAMQIQRAYRGHAQRLAHWCLIGRPDLALRHHLHDSRHFYATLIQKRARGMLTRRQYGAAVYARRCYGRNVYRRERMTESAITIQRYYRGYRVRRQLYDIVVSLQERRAFARNVGFLFKRYLGPHAITVTPDMLRDCGGIIEPKLPVAAAAAVAAPLGLDSFAPSPADLNDAAEAETRRAAAVVIQSMFRRWAAARRAHSLKEIRSTTDMSRKAETYKPFSFDDYVF